MDDYLVERSKPYIPDNNICVFKMTIDAALVACFESKTPIIDLSKGLSGDYTFKVSVEDIAVVLMRGDFCGVYFMSTVGSSRLKDCSVITDQLVGYK